MTNDMGDNMEDNNKSWVSKSVVLSIGILLLLLVAMVIMAVKHLVGTIIYPIVIIVFMFAYWLVTDVLDIKWSHGLEGKTPAQIQAYYKYAACDFIGLAGLVYFLVDMRSMTGVLIYVFGTFMKRRFNDEFKGITHDEDDEEVDEITEPVEVEAKEVSDEDNTQE